MAAEKSMGTKQVCRGCGCRFYDMGRTSVRCPGCDQPLSSTAGGGSRRKSRADREILIEVETDETDVDVATESGVETPSGALDEVAAAAGGDATASLDDAEADSDEFTAEDEDDDEDDDPDADSAEADDDEGEEDDEDEEEEAEDNEDEDEDEEEAGDK